TAISGIECPMSPLRGLGHRGRHTSGLRHWLIYAALPGLLCIPLALFFAHSLALGAGPDADLTILPPKPVLSGPHSTQQLVVEEVRSGQLAGDLTDKTKFVSQNPNVALVSPAG